MPAPSVCPFKAIVFDLDGTLTNTDPLHFRIFQQMLGERGISVDEAVYQRQISGRTNEAIVKDFFPFFSDREILQFSEEKEQRFRHLAQSQIEPMPGLMALLDWIEHHHLRTAIVTNAPRLNAEFMLHGLQLSDRFEFVVLGEDLPRAKPDPLPYETAISRLNLLPQEVLVFEDSPSGIRAAIAAHIPTIGIASTHNPQKLMALGIELAVSDFAEPALKQWLGMK